MQLVSWFAAALIAMYAQAAAAADKFTLKSADIAPNAKIAVKHVYKGFGCEGGNVSPALAWSGAPAGTKSFAVTMYDPDAPTGSGWWHWIVFNLPASTAGLEQGAGDASGTRLPAGAVQSRTDFGGPGYGGPCPPSGPSLKNPHRYIFTVFALRVDKLDLTPDSSGALVGYMLNANALDKASFTGRYGR
ncbi:MAG TPA: YbhB/YbcL family Raf kinase inhibitor-like protein [Burkholderiaceae bacterium]|nr:YbhB/YbcL family Raf kinase inhibitor-like protein [Burkholderiaceae bacterium]